MNETLETMARAIFNSWFVDFLPVRAKMAAKANASVSALPEAEPGRWFVYAIECKDGSIYIGQTEDLRQRWGAHQRRRAADWTRRHEPVRLAYWESVSTREEAVEREKWLRTGFDRKWLRRQVEASARTQTGDPVRLPAATAAQAGPKAEGRDPLFAVPGTAQAGALPQPVADLFPDRFEDSELGEIPAGWEVKRLSELCSTQYGYRASAVPEPVGPKFIRVTDINLNPA